MTTKELKEDFKKFCENQSVGSVLCYNRYLWLHKKKDWDRRKIVKYFNLLVDKEEYAQDEKKSLLDWLVTNYTNEISKKP